MPMTHNFILGTDSYKHSHRRVYPKGLRRLYSYCESRGGVFSETVFAGLQYVLGEYFAGVRVRHQDIDEAREVLGQHFGSATVFDPAPWVHLIRDHGGRIPLRVMAAPEGTVVGTGNVLMTFENTCDQCAWVTNFCETVGLQIWYPTTVSTVSREAKKVILRYLERTGDPGQVDFKLHDFGFRGVSSVESAGLGGYGHLINFKGTDTLAALEVCRQHYASPCAGYSIPATEHSVMTLEGPDGELAAMRRVLEAFPEGLVACVSDSYDIFRACREYWGGTLREQVLARNGTLIIRPDSGYPPKVVLQVLDILGERFGTTTNPKGYKVLDPHVRVIQGDGVDLDMIEEVLHQMQTAGWSADNLAFGMGGGLLQKVNRDTQKFAFKASWRDIDGVGSDVWKDPITDQGKTSKRGRLALHLIDGQYVTVPAITESNAVNQLVEVFRDGVITQRWTLDEIRERAALAHVNEALV